MKGDIDGVHLALDYSKVLTKKDLLKELILKYLKHFFPGWVSYQNYLNKRKLWILG